VLNAEAARHPNLTIRITPIPSTTTGHRLWNAAIVLGEMVDAEELDVRGKNCLELGAGAALPSLLAALVSEQAKRPASIHRPAPRYSNRPVNSNSIHTYIHT
jgi:predicted nicotinamide N-methyase